METYTATTSLLLGSLSLLAFYVYLKMKRPPNFPPGPKAWPFVGSTPYMTPDSDSGANEYDIMSGFADKYGPIYSLSFGKRWIVLINDYKVLKEAMVKNGTALAGRIAYCYVKFENPYFPLQGILNGTYSDQWKLQRHTVIQVLRRLGFGRDVTQKVITDEAEIMAETFKSSKGEAINIQDHISNAVSNVMMSLLFGQRYNYEEKELREIRHTVDEMFASNEETFFLDHITGASLIPSMRKMAQRGMEVNAKFTQLLQNKIKQIPKDGNLSEPTNFVEGYHLEREKNPEIENRLYQVTSDFIQAGFETTNTALGWSVFFLLEHPEIQKKVQEEIDEVVGRNRKPTLGDKEKLPYVEATLLETLRLGRIAPATLPHETMEDVNIGGYQIPKGTEVWGNLWHILKDPNVWPEPEVFKPERFLDENGKCVKKEELVAFGIGRRACLGEQLARQELFLFFVHLLHEFNIEIADGEKLPKRVGRVAITYQAPKFNIKVTCRD